jgi:hypothetical protein
VQSHSAYPLLFAFLTLLRTRGSLRTLTWRFERDVDIDFAEN